MVSLEGMTCQWPLCGNCTSSSCVVSSRFLKSCVQKTLSPFLIFLSFSLHIYLPLLCHLFHRCLLCTFTPPGGPDLAYGHAQKLCLRARNGSYHTPAGQRDTRTYVHTHLGNTMRMRVGCGIERASAAQPPP